MAIALARLLAPLLIVVVSSSAYAVEQEKRPADKSSEVKTETKCEHGVKQTICARCNPKLEPVFRAKKDWCEEHKRPESQCSICNPELKKNGIK